MDLVAHDPQQERTYPPLPSAKICLGCQKKQRELPSGVTLKHCKACGIALYCGETCQRQDWASHKIACKLNRGARSKLEEMEYPRMYKDLEKFDHTFEAEIFDAAAYALGIHFDHTAGNSTAFEVFLKYVPDGEKPYTRFNVERWKCTPFSELEGEAQPLVEGHRQTASSAPRGYPVIFVVLRASVRAHKGVVLGQSLVLDPDLGRWNPKWEEDFLEGIRLVQKGLLPKIK